MGARVSQKPENKRFEIPSSVTVKVTSICDLTCFLKDSIKIFDDSEIVYEN